MSRVVLAAALLVHLWTGVVLTGNGAGLHRPAFAGAPGALQWLALGEDALAARLAMLAVQSADDQAGQHVPLRDLDYVQLERWLEAALQRDPRSQYPLQAAAMVYAAVPDPQRSRRMVAFVERHFEEDPIHRRVWMERAVAIARHHLHDPALAAALQAKLDRVQGGASPAGLRLD